GVRPLASHFRGRECWRHLLDLANEPGQRLFDFLTVGWAVNGHGCNDALRVIAVAPCPETNAGSVRLNHRLHVLCQPCSDADAKHEHAGRERVERARVADASAAREPALCTIHGVARRHAARFVEHEQAVIGTVIHRLPPTSWETPVAVLAKAV